MTPEELFEKYKHLAEATVYKHYKDPRGIAKKYNIQLEDLFQYALEALWESCLDFDETKGNCKFQSFAITKIKWVLSTRINRDCKEFSFRGTGLNAKHIRKNTRIISLDDVPHSDSDDSVSHHELIGDNYNLEGEAMGTLLEKIIKEKFNERDLIALKRLNEGAYLREIGEDYGISHERVRQRVKKLKQQLRRELLG